MKLPRDLSGRELADALCRHWDYHQLHQAGSHIILETATPTHHRLAVPAHQALRVGTLNSILRSVAVHKGLSRDALIDAL